MGYRSTVITTDGLNLMQRVLEGTSTIMFTKVCTSEKPYSEFEIKQEVAVSRQPEDPHGVLLQASFSNVSVSTGYEVNVIGIFAKDSANNEILFSYSESDGTPDEIIAYDGVSPKTYTYNIHTGIKEDDGVIVEINPDGLATLGMLENKMDKFIVPTRSALGAPSIDKIGRIYYITDEDAYVKVSKVSDTTYGYEDITYTDALTAPTPTLNAYYHNTTSDKYYKSVGVAQPLTEKEFEVADTLPIAGTYVNDTLVIVASASLYRADASQVGGYEDLTSVFSTTTDIEAETKVAGHYYLDTTRNKLYLYADFEWQEIEVNIVSTLPTPDSSTVDKYYLVGTTLSIGIETPAQYAWVNAGQGNTREVIIPATGWTTVGAGATAYYTIDINVAGMTSGFVGTSACEPKRPEPFVKADLETIMENWGYIASEGGIWSHDGYIEVISSTIPSAPFTILLHGV